MLPPFELVLASVAESWVPPGVRIIHAIYHRLMEALFTAIFKSPPEKEGAGGQERIGHSPGQSGHGPKNGPPGWGRFCVDLPLPPRRLERGNSSLNLLACLVVVSCAAAMTQSGSPGFAMPRKSPIARVLPDGIAPGHYREMLDNCGEIRILLSYALYA